MLVGQHVPDTSLEAAVHTSKTVRASVYLFLQWFVMTVPLLTKFGEIMFQPANKKRMLAQVLSKWYRGSYLVVSPSCNFAPIFDKT